jgi:drug/metabolite transporter (DMT)-like permease
MVNLSERSGPTVIANHDFKTVGLVLALCSGLFIGASFIFKKKGLIQASDKKSGVVAGESHSYLSNGLWWTGMLLMIVGEICNFIAYAFTQAILVTPLGALSVVISAVLSSIFLNERLTMHGKIGCAQCIIGAVIILMHAPDQQSANTIEEFQRLFFAPVFLVYAILAILISVVVIWKVAPKYGSKNMLVYIGICSLIGSLSVVATQGLGSALVTSIMGQNQFTHWFLYFLGAFVITTLLTEINYLNKALNLFNTAMVTPVYYVTFTSLTMVSSAILFQGFTAPPVNIISVVLGFLVICSGIVLLQTSKGTTMDGRGSVYVDDRFSIASDISLEPGASEIRGSFGSIRRYSMHHGRGHPQQSSGGSHRRTMSLNLSGFHNRRGSTASNTLSPINETPASPNSSGLSRNIDTTPTQISIAMGENPYDKDGVELPSRVSTIRFASGGALATSMEAAAPAIISTPAIHTTTSSPPHSPPQPHLILPPPLSPLQHPINYIQQHQQHIGLTPAQVSEIPATTSSEEYSSGLPLPSPQNIGGTPTQVSEIQATTSSEEYSGGSQKDRKGSTASRRSQNTMTIMDKFKFGLTKSGDNEDSEGLVSPISNIDTGANDNSHTGVEGYGSYDDANSNGSVSPIP